MATKKGTTRKSSAKKATKKKTVENVEKKQGNQRKENPYKNNGGARKGAGRKPNPERERLVTLKEMAEEHALEELDVPMMVQGQAKMVKMTRTKALLNMLWEEAVKNKNISAAKEYGDRTRGRARQEIDMTGEISTKDQYTPNDPALLEAQKAYANAVKKMIVTGEYGE